MRAVILLPAGIDTDFVTAQYRNGVLSIILAKTNRPAGHRTGEIIIY